MRLFWVMTAAVGALMWWMWSFTVSVVLSSFLHVRSWSASFWTVAVVALVPGFAAAVLPGLTGALGGPVPRRTLGWAVGLLCSLAVVSLPAGGMWLLPPAALYMYARRRVGVPA